MAQITVVYKDFEEMKAVARVILGLNGEQPVEAPKMEVPKEEPVKTEEAPKEEPVEEEITYTLVDVRAKLSALNKAGKKDEVQELIRSFGVEKLSQIDEKYYAEVMKKAGEL